MKVRISRRQALAWRMRRQLLDPIGRPTVAEVVDRLCGVQAQVASSAELAIRTRRQASRRGEVARALRDGRLLKTWAMRGTLHLLTPEQAGIFLSVVASGRSWERPSWQRFFGVTSKEIDRLRRTVRTALADGPLTREELAAAVSASRGLRHVGEALGSSWGTLLKPLAWQGVLCHGPSRGNRVTFVRPEDASPRWAGLPEPDEAAPEAVVAYVRAYGPTTVDAFGAWLAGGWFGTRKLRAWFDELTERLAGVDVEGTRAYVLADDVDELVSIPPTRTVRLLPGFDQYVLGPGTRDGQVVPEARRRVVSRQSGWISPVIVAGGAVSGTWEVDGASARVTWFREAGRPPKRALDAEVARWSALLDRDLGLEIAVAD